MKHAVAKLARDATPIHGQQGVGLGGDHQLINLHILIRRMRDKKTSRAIDDAGDSMRIQKGRVTNGIEAGHGGRSGKAGTFRGLLMSGCGRPADGVVLIHSERRPIDFPLEFWGMVAQPFVQLRRMLDVGLKLPLDLVGRVLGMVPDAVFNRAIVRG